MVHEPLDNAIVKPGLFRKIDADQEIAPSQVFDMFMIAVVGISARHCFDRVKFLEVQTIASQLIQNFAEPGGLLDYPVSDFIQSLGRRLIKSSSKHSALGRYLGVNYARGFVLRS